jgi:hypothetical protein
VLRKQSKYDAAVAEGSSRRAAPGISLGLMFAVDFGFGHGARRP